MVSGLIAAVRRRSERRRRVPVPFCSRWRDATPFTAVACPPDDGGDARRRARTAHTARQAERARPEAGRQTAETAATAGRAPRAQPTLANGQRTREVVPLPPLKFPLGGDPPKGVSPTRGRGERPVGAAGEGERPDAKQNAQLCPTPRQARRPAARQAAGGAPRPRTRGRKTAAGIPSRGRTGERGQRPSRPDGRRRGGQRARELLPHHHARQLGRDHASGRRRGGAAGGDGAGRAALGRDCWPPTPCHQRGAHLSGASAARPTQTGATSTGRRPGARPPGAEHSRPALRVAQGQADAQPGKPPGAQRTGAAARRGRFWPPVRLCGGFFRLWVISHASPHARTPQNGAKSLDLGLVLCALIVLYLFGGV